VFRNINKTVFLDKTGQWIMSRNIIFLLLYHRHKLLDLIKEACSCGDDWGGFGELEGATLFAGKKDWQQMLHEASQMVAECWGKVVTVLN
jgi:hypothetical protein